MAISDSNRKLLWGRSMGCCAMCRCPLTEGETGRDPAVVLGEEAHIVSPMEGGPRYRPLPRGEVDAYTNRLLLCPSDHAKVDRQEGHYTESRLLEIKAEHERWARERQRDGSPARIRDLQPGLPSELSRMISGAALVRAVAPAEAIVHDKPDDLADEVSQLVGELFQSLHDLMDLWSDLGPAEHVRQEVELSRQLRELREAGLVVFAGIRKQRLEGGAGPPLPWRLSVVVVDYLDRHDGADTLLVKV